MQPIPTTLLIGRSGVDATSYVTGDLTGNPNKFTTLLVVNRRSTATSNVPTVTGGGYTWTLIDTQNHIDGNTRVSMFRAVSAAPVTGPLTIDFAGETQQYCHWIVEEWAGAKNTGTNGADGVRQSKTGRVANTSTSMTITLDNAIRSPFNVVYGGMGLVDTPLGIAAGDGETELNDQQETSTSPNSASQDQYEVGQDTSMTWSFGSGGNQPTGIIIEIDFLYPSASQVI